MASPASLSLHTPLAEISGIGPQKALLLASELNLLTVEDLLFHVPFKYVDRSTYHNIAQLNEEMPYVQVIGKIISLKMEGGGRAKRLVGILEDATGQAKLVWFKGAKWIEKNLKLHTDYVIFGKPSHYMGQANFAHPEMELYNPQKIQEEARWVPFYSSTEKLKRVYLDSKGLHKLIIKVLPQVIHLFPENLPDYLLQKYKLPHRQQAIHQLHHPSSEFYINRSEARLKFEELFYMQLQFQQTIQHRKEKIVGIVMEKRSTHYDPFVEHKLPFQLTPAQEKVVAEIREDLKSGFQMNRLLQGDVGSGKTIVAFLIMLLAKDNGYQSAIMAPTEILARQHYETLYELAKVAGLRVALLTGSTSTADRKQLFYLLKEGEIDVLIGTHALIEDPVVFKNLGLCVIDEQHRFGVEQRAKLQLKGISNPHILVMTATPIPRTLALTVYGDLDTSIIDELPKGRIPIKTIHRRESQKATLAAFVKKEIEAGRQAYIIYPLIEESEKLDLKDLMEGYNTWTEIFPMPTYEVSMVHGKMKADQKNHEMKRFADGHAHILVATTVIEVGVNVPNASVMIIENAERFGLSQLHQLRGRVGRGKYQSYCVLLSRDDLGPDARKRIQTMVQTNNGFEISEVDLQLRGPGDMLGTRQSGMLDLKIANLLKDQNIVFEARKVAEQLIKEDPKLQAESNRIIKTWIDYLNKRKNYFSVA